MASTKQVDADTAAQNPVSGSANGQLLPGNEGYVPQPKGGKYPVNSGKPGATFYTPHTSPPSGSALKHFSDGKQVPKLFQPLTIRGVEFKNRIFVSPMCQYSAPHNTGMPTEWHLVHQGQFAIRGFGLVMTEASSVLDNGGITAEDLGIWSDEHIPAYKRIVDFHHSLGTVAGIQLAHAGRKSSTPAPWLTDGLVGKPPMKVDTHFVPPEAHGWKSIWGPSAIPFNDLYPVPKEMDDSEIIQLKQAFVDGTKRAKAAGYDVIELHAAHGYLLHSFLSPASNQRKDKYGGSLENRMRLTLETTKLVRAEFEGPLFVRISASDWDPEGEKNDDGSYRSWGIEQSIELAKQLKALGVDLIDTSSGGLLKQQAIKIGPGYQVPFAEALKKEEALKDLLIGSVGLLTDGKQCEEILQKGQADVVLLARETLRHADFVFDAAQQLETVINVPVQYQRAFTRMFKK